MSTSALKASSGLPTNFRGIQALRGIAAIMVVFNHATLTWWHEVGSGSLNSPFIWEKGAAGVDIFFIISGFVMAVATRGRDRGRHPALCFLERRAFRIFPMYWFVTGLFILDIYLVRILPQLSIRTDFYSPLSWGYLFSSLLLRPNYRLPIIAVAWTLSIECFFYLLFALALALRIKPLRLLAPLLTLFGVLGIIQRPTWPGITLLFSLHHFEFLAGLFLGYTVIHRNRIAPLLAGVLGLTGMAFLFVPSLNLPGTRVISWGVPAFLIVLATLALEDPLGHLWPRFMLLVGDASYSLYLAHVLTLHYIVLLFERLGIFTVGVIRLRDDILTAAVTLPIAILFAILLYRNVERPINNNLRKHLLHEGKPRAQAV